MSTSDVNKDFNFKAKASTAMFRVLKESLLPAQDQGLTSLMLE